MSQPLIVLGDKTNHGGVVITAAPTSDTGNIRIARMGDQVSCPRCKGVFPIMQGDASLIIDGAPAAYNNCTTACGASLISSQTRTVTTPSSGAGAGAGGDATNALAQSFGSIGTGLIASYQDKPLDEVGQRFQGRFQVLDRVTGEAVTGKDVRLRSTGGQYLTGTTDAEGYTQWVERDAAEALAFDLIEQGSDSDKS